MCGDATIATPQGLGLQRCMSYHACLYASGFPWLQMLCFFFFFTLRWVLSQKRLCRCLPELSERAWHFILGETEACGCSDFLMANLIMAELGLPTSELRTSMAGWGANRWLVSCPWVLWACCAICPPDCLHCHNDPSSAVSHNNSYTSGKGPLHLPSAWT